MTTTSATRHFWDSEPEKIPRIRNLAQLELIKKIGETHFAQVYMAKEKKTGMVVAVKALNKKAAAGNMVVRRSWETEVQCHKNLDHPFIVQLYDVFEDVDHKYLILEYCEQGDLLKYFNGFLGKLSESDVSYYIKQAALALAYLHCHQPVWIHRDVKLENCLIGSDGNLRLADFGSVGQLARPTDRRATLCGTVDYLAPEVVNKEGVDQKADVWALGIMTYEMLVGTAPFSNFEVLEDIYDAIAHADLRIPNHFTRECKDFLLSTLNKNEPDRMDMEQVASHPFLNMYHPNMYEAPARPSLCPAP